MCVGRGVRGWWFASIATGFADTDPVEGENWHDGDSLPDIVGAGAGADVGIDLGWSDEGGIFIGGRNHVPSPL